MPITTTKDFDLKLDNSDNPSMKFGVVYQPGSDIPLGIWKRLNNNIINVKLSIEITDHETIIHEVQYVNCSTDNTSQQKTYPNYKFIETDVEAIIRNLPPITPKPKVVLPKDDFEFIPLRTKSSRENLGIMEETDNKQKKIEAQSNQEITDKFNALRAKLRGTSK